MPAGETQCFMTEGKSCPGTRRASGLSLLGTFFSLNPVLFPLRYLRIFPAFLKLRMTIPGAEKSAPGVVCCVFT